MEVIGLQQYLDQMADSREIVANELDKLLIDGGLHHHNASHPGRSLVWHSSEASSPTPAQTTCSSLYSRQTSHCSDDPSKSSSAGTNGGASSEEVESSMEPPVRDVHTLPVIKCSACDEDVDMMAMSSHKCATTTPATTSQPLPRTKSFSSLRKQQSRRPFLPKIDPTAACSSTALTQSRAHPTDHELDRPPVWQGELTPASSGHSSMVSPASATSASRPPWPQSRKGSMPESRRPPSPELTNLDCAFPPFPLPPRAATTRKRDRAVSQRSGTHRSRSRDPLKSARQDSLSREGSSNNTAQGTSGGHIAGKRSRPSTPSSRTGSVSTGSASRQQSIDTVPEVHITPIDEVSTTSVPEVTTPAESSVPALLHRTYTEPLPLRSPSIDPGLSAFDFGTTETNTTPPIKTENEIIPNPSEFENKQGSETHPSYKTKRPPPLAHQQSELIFSKVKSPISPQPPSAGVFATTFGRLFGRRPSHSASPRREFVRQALSDEPEVYGDSTEESSIPTPDGERTFFIAEASPTSPVPEVSPGPSPVHEESLKALEGVIPAPAPIPVVVIEPTPEKESSETVLVTQPEPPRFPRISRIMEDPPTFVQTPLSETSRRDSIDSASSYGSIGFSERTTISSTSSSSPQSEPLPSRPSKTAQWDLSDPSVADMPAPLRPRIPALSPDSPTDPLFQHGRLSPIPDMVHESLHPMVHESDATPTPPAAPVLVGSSAEPDVPTGRKPKQARPNKGICRGCSQVILASQKSVSSADGLLTGRYHKECFGCRTCKATFPTAEFYVHEDKPYCAHHYHEVANSLCATCGKGIEGLYMETTNVAGRGKEKHHPECLKCTTCRVRLDHDYFELSGKVYCERDAFRQASLPKARENAPSRPSPLIREYISSGQDGLVKGRNFPERRTTKLLTMT